MLPINMINGLALTRDPLVVLVMRQQPHQKMYKLRTGCVNMSHSHKPGNREHTKATAQETCDSWQKRGNEAYKSGDLSEAEQSPMHEITFSTIDIPKLLSQEIRSEELHNDVS
ncbi:hypothetical protein Lser_V15G33684 [Lactuca serriola]